MTMIAYDKRGILSKKQLKKFSRYIFALFKGYLLQGKRLVNCRNEDTSVEALKIIDAKTIKKQKGLKYRFFFQFKRLITVFVFKCNQISNFFFVVVNNLKNVCLDKM